MILNDNGYHLIQKHLQLFNILRSDIMLELKNISFKVTEETSEKYILKNINLKINGKLVAITGPNGGGKSSLGKIIAGIEKPSSGKIFYKNIDISNMSIHERSKLGISFAFQNPVTFKGITVKDLISTSYGEDLTTIEACKYLSEVGLCAKDYIDREVNSSLSGGELKRIEIATIMARSSTLSIFDEPEAGIDLWSFNKLIQVFHNLYENNRGSIVIISHQERILNIADQIIVMENGEIINSGIKEMILPKLLDISRPCKVMEEKNNG